MNYLFTITVYVLFLFQLILAIGVFRVAKHSLNRYYSILIAVQTVWAYLSILPILYSFQPNSYLGQMVMFTVTLGNYCFVKFTGLLEGRESVNKKTYLVLTFLSLVVCLLPGSLFNTLYSGQDIKFSFNFGMSIIFIHAVISLYVAFGALLRKRKAAINPRDINLILYSSFALWIVAPITHFVAMGLFKNQMFFILSPFYTFISMLIIAYAIIKNNLFDARAVVVKVVSQFFSGLIVIAINASFLVILLREINLREYDQTSAITIIVMISIVTALTYSYVLSRISVLVNRFLYREEYVIEVILKDISEELILTTDSTRHLTKALSKLCLATNSSHAKLYIEERPLAQYLNTKRGENLESVEYILQGVTGEERCRIVFGDRVDSKDYTKKDLLLIELSMKLFSMGINSYLHQARVKKMNENLNKEISKATKQLRQKNRDLRRRDQEKDEFISITSHQLRTPITSLRGYTSLLLSERYGELNTKQIDVLRNNKNTIIAMAQTVNSLLTSAQIDNNSLNLNLELVDLNSLTRNVIETCKADAEERGIDIIYEMDAHLTTIKADESKIREVVQNIIENAIQYSPTSTSVLVRLENLGNEVKLEVIDKGRGIDPKDHHLIFEKFSRLKSAQKQRNEGTGLGLYILKEVILKHGGTIIFRSKPGKGSTFGFILKTYKS